MKTRLLTTTLLLASIALFAQENKNKTIFLNAGHKITDIKDYKYIRIVEDYKAEKTLYTINEYFKSGKMSMSAFSSDRDNLNLEGIRIDYYENGNKRKQSNYVNNKLNGLQIEWYESGEKKLEQEIIWNDKRKDFDTKLFQFWNNEGQQLIINGNGQYEKTDKELYESGEIKEGKRNGTWTGKYFKLNFTFIESYENGELVSGISTDKNNNKFPYKELMKKPKPPNGITNFYQYIGRNFKLSKEASLQKISGKINVTFVVDEDGKIIEPKVLRHIGYDTDKEAIRVLEKAENWIPGKMRGVPAKVLYSLPISIQTARNNNQQSTPERGSDIIKNTNPSW